MTVKYSFENVCLYKKWKWHFTNLCKVRDFKIWKFLLNRCTQKQERLITERYSSDWLFWFYTKMILTRVDNICCCRLSTHSLGRWWMFCRIKQWPAFPPSSSSIVCSNSISMTFKMVTRLSEITIKEATLLTRMVIWRAWKSEWWHFSITGLLSGLALQGTIRIKKNFSSYLLHLIYSRKLVMSTRVKCYPYKAVEFFIW